MIYTVTLNPAIDYVVRLDAPLAPGTLQRAAAEDYQYGGKGINVSTVLARLGVPTTALGFVAGATGAWLQQGVAGQGIHTDFIALPQGMTRINVKVKAADGAVVQETEINGRGPQIDAEALSLLEEKLAALTAQDLLVLAGSLPADLPSDTYQRLMAPLAARGVRVVVDAGGEALRKVLPHRPFLIKPNHQELSELFGRTIPSTDFDLAAECACALQQQGARNVLVSMGGAGAVLVDEQHRQHRLAAPQGRVVNTVGAGDSMVAGFLAGWLGSGNYGQALRLGTACGSATAFTLGLAEKPTVEALLRQMQ